VRGPSLLSSVGLRSAGRSRGCTARVPRVHRALPRWLTCLLILLALLLVAFVAFVVWLYTLPDDYF